MVAAVRSGEAQRSVARRYGVSLSTVQFWVSRATDQPLDTVAWSDRRSGPPSSSRRTSQEWEDLVLQLRRDLRHQDALGEYGAEAIHRALVERPEEPVPSVRTIHRILERRGVLDSQQRVRHRPPPPGWYLPDVAAGRVELDQFDVIEGLVIKNGPQIAVLTAVSLHGGLVAAWPRTGITAKIVREALWSHWGEVGLPAYAQFDNSTVFQGPHQHVDAIGSVIRLCLSLGVVPVFAPPRESGFQAAIESFNGRWQEKVWQRFPPASLESLQAQSLKYVTAHRQRSIVRREAAPERRILEAAVKPDLQARPQGRIIFVRRTTDQGHVHLLGRTFEIVPLWTHRLVRCQVELNEDVIRFFSLRRRAPDQQLLLGETPYVLPYRPFRE